MSCSVCSTCKLVLLQWMHQLNRWFKMLNESNQFKKHKTHRIWIMFIYAKTTSERNTYLTPLETFLPSCNIHLSPWIWKRAIPSIGATCNDKTSFTPKLKGQRKTIWELLPQLRYCSLNHKRQFLHQLKARPKKNHLSCLKNCSWILILRCCCRLDISTMCNRSASHLQYQHFHQCDDQNADQHYTWKITKKQRMKLLK